MSDENAVKLAKMTKSSRKSQGLSDNHVPESLPQTARSTTSQCEWCHKKFKSKQTLLAHQKTCSKTMMTPLKFDKSPHQVQDDILNEIVTIGHRHNGSLSMTLPIAAKKPLTQTKESTSQTVPIKQTNTELLMEIELTKKALAELPLEFALRENMLQVRKGLLLTQKTIFY